MSLAQIYLCIIEPRKNSKKNLGVKRSNEVPQLDMHRPKNLILLGGRNTTG